MDVDLVVVVDPARGAPLVVAEARASSSDDAAAARADAEARISSLAAALRRPRAIARTGRSVERSLANGAIESRSTRGAFLAAVRAAKRHIARGDCQQIVLSQRFDRRGSVDPVEAFAALRAINPSPYLFLVELGARALVGSSPETLVRVSGSRGDRRTVVVKPIAGTRRRGEGAAEDARLEAELRADPKENAEHAMLLDLGRNDVGRVARFGSVVVAQRAEVERYARVMHLVSEVRGELRRGVHEIDALRAAFPAGTLSGSPKVRAIEILRALEPCPRGTYGGAVGFVDSGGALDLAITIRTLAITEGRVSVQAGAGIVHDSSPTSEFDETVHKASAVLRAAELAGGRHG